MSAKISILDELAGILTKKEKRDEGVLHFSKQFKIGHLLKPFSSVKQQGFTLMSILVALILLNAINQLDENSEDLLIVAQITPDNQEIIISRATINEED